MFCLPNDGVAGAVEMPIAAVVLRGLFLAVKIYFFAARFNDFHIFPLLLGVFVKNTLKRAAVAEAIKVDVRYALGQNHPFQIVAKIEQCLLYLASVRQNAGFEFAALAESRLFYQSNSVGNNDIFYVPPANAFSPIVATEPSSGILLFVPPAKSVLVFFSVRHLPVPL